MTRDKRYLLMLAIPLLLLLQGLNLYTPPANFKEIEQPILSANKPENTPGFILPEIPMGPISVIASMLAAILLFSKRPIMKK